MRTLSISKIASLLMEGVIKNQPEGLLVSDTMWRERDRRMIDVVRSLMWVSLTHRETSVAHRDIKKIELLQSSKKSYHIACAVGYFGFPNFGSRTFPHPPLDRSPRFKQKVDH